MSEIIQNNQYSWIELAALVANGKMVRNEFVRVDDSQAINKWRKRFNNTDIFYSICLYEQPKWDSKFIVPIFFDVDSPDNLEGARRSAITLCELIMEKIKVPQDQLEIYFSGSKGFHVIVPIEVFKPFCSPIIFRLYKKMAEKAVSAGVSFVDTLVYTARRIFRFSNSRHRRSGLFKVPLFFEELRDCSADTILKMATVPRGEDSFVIPRACAEAEQWYQVAVECFHKGQLDPAPNKKINAKFQKGWRMPPCIKAIQEAVIPDGMRHGTFLSFARYCGYLNMHPEEIKERIEAIDERNPIRDPDSIERIIKFGCEHPGFPGCDDPCLGQYCRKEICFYAELKDRCKD